MLSTVQKVKSLGGLSAVGEEIFGRWLNAPVWSSGKKAELSQGSPDATPEHPARRTQSPHSPAPETLPLALEGSWLFHYMLLGSRSEPDLQWLHFPALSSETGIDGALTLPNILPQGDTGQSCSPRQATAPPCA